MQGLTCDNHYYGEEIAGENDLWIVSPDLAICCNLGGDQVEDDQTLMTRSSDIRLRPWENVVRVICLYKSGS